LKIIYKVVIILQNTINRFIKKTNICILSFKKKLNSFEVADEIKEKSAQVTDEIIYYSCEIFGQISNKIIYKKHPLFIITENKKVEILTKLLNLLNDNFNLKAMVGIELEFYLYKDKKTVFSQQAGYLKTVKKMLRDIYSKAKKESIDITKLDSEKGIGQIEVRTKPYVDLIKLASDVGKLKEIINNIAIKAGFIADFTAQPFMDDCGNALQVNISLLNKDGYNVFERVATDYEKSESNELLCSVGGLCKLMNISLPFFVSGDDCYKRYNLDLNKFLYEKGKYPAPTFISWGINNRTTAIRISSAVFKNIQQYEKEGDKNRRIEYRVPSATANIYMSIIGVLIGIIYGLTNKIDGSSKKTYFNVFEKNTGFEKLSKNFEEQKQEDMQQIYKLLFW
jgi:glutamine synthetase